MSLRKPAGPSQEGAELGFEPSSIDAEIVLCSPPGASSHGLGPSVTITNAIYTLQVLFRLKFSWPAYGLSPLSTSP